MRTLKKTLNFFNIGLVLMYLGIAYLGIEIYMPDTDYCQHLALFRFISIVFLILGFVFLYVDSCYLQRELTKLNEEISRRINDLQEIEKMEKAIEILDKFIFLQYVSLTFSNNLDKELKKKKKLFRLSIPDLN